MMLQAIISLCRIFVCSAILIALLLLTPPLAYAQTTYQLITKQLHVTDISYSGEYSLTPSTVGYYTLTDAGFYIEADAYCLEFAEESTALLDAEATFTWEFTGQPNTSVSVLITGRKVLTSQCIGFLTGDVAHASNVLAGSPNIFGSGDTSGLTFAYQYGHGSMTDTDDVTEEQVFLVTLGASGKGTLTITHSARVTADATIGNPNALGYIMQGPEGYSYVYVHYGVTIL